MGNVKNSVGKVLFKIEFVDGDVKEYKESFYIFAMAKAVSDKVDEMDDCIPEDIMMKSLSFLNSNYQWEYIIKDNRFTIGVE